MRALFLTHAYPRHPGDPVGSFVLRLAAALATHGIACEVLAPAAPDLPAREAIEHVPVRRYRYAPRRWETLAYTGSMAAQVRSSWTARAALAGMLASAFTAASRALRRGRFDLVHAHWWFPSGLVGAWSQALHHTPLVTTMHGSDVRLARAFPGGRRAFATVVRASAALTTVSSWLAREATAFDAAARPIVAPMPVAGDLFHPPAAEVRLPDHLLFVGKLSEQKGLHHLLRALAMMRARPTLDVVGAGRVDDAHLRTLARELHLEERINWLPLLTQAELAALYRRASIHVIPAVEEGLGLTAVESLLSETPVVAFDSGGLPDIVVPGTSGRLVPAGDVPALAATLDELLASPEERASLGQHGRAYALAHFGSDAVAARYASIYDQVLHPAAR
jgi:glycosyltransferase involved in cell wall biosynthesis